MHRLQLPPLLHMLGFHLGNVAGICVCPRLSFYLLKHSKFCQEIFMFSVFFFKLIEADVFCSHDTLT